MPSIVKRTEPVPCAEPESPRVVGYGCPPEGRPFRPGASGNPMGRPRRVAVAPAGRRLITAEPTELEVALALPVICPAADAEPVSLARAVVARLTERALAYGDVPACRELLRLCAEAEAVRAERELLAAERDAAERAAREAAEAQAETQARAARVRAQEAAFMALEVHAEQAAIDAAETALDNSERALRVLDAVEVERGKDKALKPWVVEAATAHSPHLPRAVDLRPLDLADIQDGLDRMELAPWDTRGDYGLPAWFIDAARARRPKWKPAPGDEALLQIVRVEEPDDPDWEARLAVVEAMLKAGSG